MNGQQMSAPVDPAPAEDATYLEKGRYAFAIGKEKEGIDYARAHAISGSEGAADVLQQTKWYAAGLRPVTALRFAVGVVLEAPANATEFHPIGSRQLQGGGGGGGMMGMPGGEGGSGRPGGLAKAKEHALYDLTEPSVKLSQPDLQNVGEAASVASLAISKRSLRCTSRRCWQHGHGHGNGNGQGNGTSRNGRYGHGHGRTDGPGNG